MIVYLDENCYQRGFDDQSQARIRMESIACQEIIQRAEDGEVDLVWSFMHLDETLHCPFAERKMAILQLSALCRILVGPSDDILERARAVQRAHGCSAKDALHLACALSAASSVFLTCDDGITRKIKKLENMEIMNPIEYIRSERR